MLLVLGLAAPGLAACGGEPTEATPTPVVIPGSTVTIGTEENPGTTVTPETTPTETPTSTPTGSVATADELIRTIGGAMGQEPTVRVTTSSGDVAAGEADFDYLAGPDYVTRAADGPVQEYRRIGDTLYFLADGTDQWQVYTPGEAPAELEPVLSEALAYGLLDDLLQQLQAAQDFAFAADGPTELDGTPVETYSYTLDPTDLVVDPASAALLPDGPVGVLLSIDDQGLPVRIARTLGDGSDLTDVYTAYGEPVTVETPEVG